MDMLWCQGAQNIGLSNHKLRPTLATNVHRYDHNARPSQTDGQADGRTLCQMGHRVGKRQSDKYLPAFYGGDVLWKWKR